MLFCNWKTLAVDLPYIDTLYYSGFRLLTLHGYYLREDRPRIYRLAQAI